MSAAPGDRVGRFALVRRVGAGGMGEVWEAHDPELDRSVAIKLLRADDGHAALAREARAMAKLSHPAVITIYDVGDDDGQVWIAMELATGGTLRQWLQKPRSWREIVTAFAVAGRGLAAAHAVGLVHRDFKPDNVLVRSTGQLVVADFGLARAGHEPLMPAAVRDATPISGDDATVPGGGAPHDGAVLGTGPTATGVTAAGEIVGTPPYMAPEQHLGRAIDPRADQFAFAAALWEAVYGQRAFEQPVSGDWALSIVHDRRRPPPRDVRVPRWLRAALDRGLATERDARFPSMDAMVAVLERGLHRRRRIAVAAVLIGAVVSTAGITVMVRPPAAAEACTTAPSKMRGAWDPARRAEMQAGFAATGAPFAADAFERVAAALDERRDAWIDMHTGACKATQVDRTQSPALLDRRMACLDDRRVEMAALVDLLVSPDRAGVTAAQDAVAALPTLDSCADASALAARRPPPADPAVRQRLTELTAELARASARGFLGDWAAEVEGAGAVAAEADALGQPALVAAARFAEGHAALQLDDLAHARIALEAATRAAADAGDDEVAAGAWTQLASVVVGLSTAKEARAVLSAADASVRRDGNRPARRHALLQAEGAVLRSEGDLSAARDAFTRALALVDSELAGDPDVAIEALNNLARTEAQMGDHVAALAHQRRMLAITRSYYGAGHPIAAVALAELGVIQRQGGDLAGARATLEEAVVALERSSGPDSLQLSLALVTLGNAESQGGDHAVAIPHLERAVSIARGDTGGHLEGALRALGIARSAAGDEAGARAALDQVLPAVEQRVGKDHLEYAYSEYNHAIQLECIAGRAALAHAGDIFIAQLGAAHPAAVSARFALAQCLIETDRPAAVLALTGIHEACLTAECPPVLVAAVHSALGQLLWIAGDHAKGLAAVRQARAEYAALGAAATDELAATDAWLRAHER